MQAIVWAAMLGLLGHALILAPTAPTFVSPSPLAAMTPPADTGATAPTPAPLALPALMLPVRPDLPAAEPLGPQRPRAIVHSDVYYTRLTIHRYASYATIPLFTAEYFIGRSLYNNPTTSSRSLRHWHGMIADGIAALFAVNTVTGVWNLWDSRHDAPGRTRRYLHGLSMIAADAGFLATAMLTPPRREFRGSGGAPPDPSSANLHRALAISSMSVALGSYVMMLVWKH
jgi:hypothetical protein